MTRKVTLLTLAFTTQVAVAICAAQPASGRHGCSDIPLRLIVAPQTAGGISGDKVSIYNNPDDPFNLGTIYEDGVGGVYAEFQVCNGSNDFVLNLRNSSPVRYLNLNFPFAGPLAAADTANGAIDLTGKTIQQQGQQINEMANAALYTPPVNGQFVTCSGFMLNPLSKTVTGGNAWFKPPTIYDPVVPDCTGGTAPDLANLPTPTSDVQVKQINACTWTVSPILDSTGTYRIGVAETVKSSKTSTSVEGGQYQMPFSYEIQKQNCTP